MCACSLALFSQHVHANFTLFALQRQRDADVDELHLAASMEAEGRCASPDSDGRFVRESGSWLMRWFCRTASDLLCRLEAALKLQKLKEEKMEQLRFM